MVGAEHRRGVEFLQAGDPHPWMALAPKKSKPSASSRGKKHALARWFPLISEPVRISVPGTISQFLLNITIRGIYMIGKMSPEADPVRRRL